MKNVFRFIIAIYAKRESSNQRASGQAQVSASLFIGFLMAAYLLETKDTLNPIGV